MSRMNSRNRKKYFAMLVAAFGECCFYCGERGTYRTLLIDDFDNCGKHNRLNDLRLACRVCNVLKNPERSRKGLWQSPVCGFGYERPPFNSAEMEKNATAEPRFRRWLLSELARKGRKELQEAINSGSEISKCSQEAVKRYIKRVCSNEGWAIIVPEDESTSYIEMRKELHCWMFPDAEDDSSARIKVTKVSSSQPAKENDEGGKQLAVDGQAKPS